MELNEYLKKVEKLDPDLLSTIKENYTKRFIFRRFLKNYEFLKNIGPYKFNSLPREEDIKKNTFYSFSAEFIRSHKELDEVLFDIAVSKTELLNSKLFYIFEYRGVLFFIREFKSDGSSDIVNFSLLTTTYSSKLTSEDFNLIVTYSSSLNETIRQSKKNLFFTSNLGSNEKINNLEELNSLI
jgi:hypothetical protein